VAPNHTKTIVKLPLLDSEIVHGLYMDSYIYTRSHFASRRSVRQPSHCLGGGVLGGGVRLRWMWCLSGDGVMRWREPAAEAVEAVETVSWCKVLASFDSASYGEEYLTVEKCEVLQSALDCSEEEGWVKVKRRVRKSACLTRCVWEEKSSGWVPSAFVERLDGDAPAFNCTGQCGRAWSSKEEVSAWSSRKNKGKPWCFHCGPQHKGKWNNHGKGWLEAAKASDVAAGSGAAYISERPDLDWI
jgi:hypothetical protein